MTIENLRREQINAIAREQLEQKGILRVRVITSSMYPLVRAGETIVIEPAKSFAPGDIVLFRQGEVWMAHRLVGRTAGGEWITKGDRAPTCDRMEIDEWIGRVVGVENATRRVTLKRAARLARLIAFLSLGAARAEQSGQHRRLRIYMVLVHVMAWLARILSETNLHE